MDNLKARNQNANINGLPTLNLDTMAGTSVPTEFEFESVFGDIVMCEVIDENENGEILRDGIWINLDVSKKVLPLPPTE